MIILVSMLWKTFRISYGFNDEFFECWLVKNNERMSWRERQAAALILPDCLRSLMFMGFNARVGYSHFCIHILVADYACRCYCCTEPNKSWQRLDFNITQLNI